MVLVFGIQLQSTQLEDDGIQALIDERLEARKTGILQGDEIREQLKAQGVILRIRHKELDGEERNKPLNERINS